MLRSILTLLAGGALAQALPLLLGPLLTRLYSPEEFGAFHLFSAVAVNLSVVACARYEFALPLVQHEQEALDLRRLSRRILIVTTLLSTLGGAGWAWVSGLAWALWLGPAVGVAGALSLATMEATRQQAFRPLALARVVQYAGAAALQALAGLWPVGALGLVVSPALTQALSALLLHRASPPSTNAAATRTATASAAESPSAQPASTPAPTRLRETAHRWREFPLLNTPHAFLGALQDTVAVALIASVLGPAAAGFWGLALRYLKAPATLVGSAVSQVLYPQLSAHGPGPSVPARAALRRVMAALGAMGLLLTLVLMAIGPWLFQQLFGDQWREAGQLARVLAPYIGTHFVAAPLAVVTMAWGAQAWALRLALWGQAAFVVALALGLWLGGLDGAGIAVSLAMTIYFGVYFWRLATWPCPDNRPTAKPTDSAPG